MRLLRGFCRASKPAEQTREELVAELLTDGFLELKLSKKSRRLLAEDVTEMNDYSYWCALPRAREAKALVKSQRQTA